MTKRLYVGNLAFSATADDLRELFGQYGSVSSADVITDRETGRSRGFGFVEMSDGGDGAVEALNGTEMQGRTLTVNEASCASSVVVAVVVVVVAMVVAIAIDLSVS